MAIRHQIASLVTALIVVCALQSHAEAGVITSVTNFSTPGSSTGNIGPVGATPAPNNDNETSPSPNVIPYMVFFNTPGTLETEFAVAASAGATEYRFTQTFVNNTGQAWAGFIFELGFGTGASFVRSTEFDFLDFDAPTNDPAATSPFTTLSQQADVIQGSGGTVPSIGSAVFSLAIDVPDLGPDGRFTLRQTPLAIPEPASALFAGFGIGLLSLVMRQRIVMR